MPNEGKYTAYCGLYCLDCIPSNRKLFLTVKELEKLLTDLQFREYAEFKSGKTEIFKDYLKFLATLQEIGKLECPAPCREGGGNPDCRVRKCVLSRGYEGCWECNNYQTCELLLPFKEVHPNLKCHIELIKKNGLEKWAVKRRKHYSWQPD